MINVLYDHQIFAIQTFGGISRYICELLRRVSIQEGFSAEAVAPLHINFHLMDLSGRMRGKRVRTFPKCRPILLQVNQIMARNAVRSLAPDVVHETYYQWKSVAPGKTPVVLTVHDMIHEKFREFYSAWDGTTKAKRAAVKRAEHVICVSENTRKDLMEILDVPAEKISVIYHGFELTGGPIGESLDPPSYKPYILYVGDRSRYKNFQRLLEAFAGTPSLSTEISLLCFGGGGFSNGELALMKKLGLLVHKDVVHSKGDDETLRMLYQRALAFVCPSLYEGFGIPLLEAMAMGCPVVCSNQGSIPEVVGDAAVLFDPFCLDSIGRAVESLVTDDLLRNTLASRGRERVKCFSWDKCAQMTMDVYRNIATR